MAPNLTCYLRQMSSQSIEQRYEILEPRGAKAEEEIGSGAYGVVYKAKDRETGAYFALKKIRTETEYDGISSSTLREITLLMQLKHENVVKLENVVMDKDRMSLVFELVDGDLKKYMDNHPPLELGMVKVSGFVHFNLRMVT